jgi:hypothetical protein
LAGLPGRCSGNRMDEAVLFESRGRFYQMVNGI